MNPITELLLWRCGHCGAPVMTIPGRALSAFKRHVKSCKAKP